MFGPEEKMIEANGVSLCTESTGELDSPPVLLVMGATASLVWWPESLVQTLARTGCRVIRYDHRDTGRSTTFSTEESLYTVEDMVSDLWAVADGHGLEKFHLVGMSLGGRLSQIAALQQPERILSLTLIASEPLDDSKLEQPEISPEFLKHFAQLCDLDWSHRPVVTQFLVEAARLCSGGSQEFSETEALERAEREFDRSSNLESAFRHSTIVGAGSYLGRMSELTAPTLVLQGDRDPIVAPVNGEHLQVMLPNARLHVLRGVGHELPSSRVPEIATELLDFFVEQHR